MAIVTLETIEQQPITDEQLIKAVRFLPNDPRVEILKNELEGYKWQFGGLLKAFEFDNLGKMVGDELGGLRRVLSKEEGKVFEYHLIGPIPNFTRRHIAKTFGFNPQTSKPVLEKQQVGPWPLTRTYQS